MTRFNNVKVLLDTAENYNQEDITNLIYRLEELQEAEEVAEDIAFVLISMWSLVPVNKKVAFKERMTDEIVNVEIAEMFHEGGFKKDTNCRNCGGAMWWEPDMGWFHQSGGYCVGADPYLGDV